MARQGGATFMREPIIVRLMPSAAQFSVIFCALIDPRLDEIDLLA
jgi:hypothetical protein